MYADVLPFLAMHVDQLRKRREFSNDLLFLRLLPCTFFGQNRPETDFHYLPAKHAGVLFYKKEGNIFDSIVEREKGRERVFFFF